MNQKPEEGIIELGNTFADELGFTADKFEGYLWFRPPDIIWISFIVSTNPGKGNLSLLMNTLWSRGYTIKVPTPFARMESILKKKGFKQTWEITEVSEKMGGEECEVWIRGPK